METKEIDLQLEFFNVTENKGEETTKADQTLTKYHESSDKNTAEAAFKKEIEVDSDSYAWTDDGEYTKTGSKYTVTNVDYVKDNNGDKVKEVDPNSLDTETKLYKYTITYTQKYTETSVKETSYFKANKDLSDFAIEKGNTKTTVRLDYITFNRQVYRPNEIVADLVFGTALSATDLQNLLKTKVRLYRTERSSSSGALSVKETFKGFYVHDVKPLKMAGQNLYVRLHIYSLDHQLNQRKYSRTYVGCRLFSDILLSGCDLTEEWKKGVFHYNTYPFALPFPFATYFSIDTSDTSKTKTFSNIDHLTGTITTQLDIERIQPYLVQYNESFYEFIARTANRCGEFFYWDNGKLQFGRQSAGSDTVITDADCLSIYYTAFNGDNKSNFENDYLTIDDRNNLSDSNPDHNYSGASTLYDSTSDASGYFYDDEVNHDVYRTKLYKDKFSSYKHEMHSNGRKYLFKLIFMLLESHTIYEFLQNTLSSQVMEAIIAARQAAKTNGYYNRYHIFDDKRLNTDLRKDSTVKDKETLDALFTALDAKGHVDAAFYHPIRKCEEALSKEMIVFNLANSKSLRLGQLITYKVKDSDSSGTSYVIVQIKDKPATNSAKGSRFAALDAASEASFRDMGDAVMQVVAIPLSSDSKVYPPMRPEGHIRRAEPQKAIVSDFLDPQHQGRVRIKYPWQNSDETEASPWIPVLTPSSTPESGCSFELAKDDEVLVDYESGNVERPYVCGTLFNRKNPTRFRRGDMTLISKNGHGICFDDPVDSLKFADSFVPLLGFVHDMWPESELGSINELRLTGGTTISDEYGLYKIEMSSDQRKIDISSPMGKVNIDAFTGITINAPNGDINIKGQNINIEAGNAIKITSGTNIKQQHWFDPGDQGAGIAVLGILGKGVADMIRPLINIVDLDFLRKLIQVFVRPIDGTLEIKSHKYLLLEAGKGEAAVKADRYDKKMFAAYEPDDTTFGIDFLYLSHALFNIEKQVEKTMTQLGNKKKAVIAAVNNYNTIHGDLVASLSAANGLTAAAVISEAFDIGTGHAKVVHHGYDYDYYHGAAAPATEEPAAGHEYNDAEKLHVKNVNQMVKACANLRAVAADYFACYCQHRDDEGQKAFGRDSVHGSFKPFFTDAQSVDDIKGLVHIEDFQDNAYVDYSDSNVKKEMKRKWFIKVLDLVRNDANLRTNYPYQGNLTHANWVADVNNLSLNTAKYNNWDKFGQQLSNAFLEDYNALFQAFTERDHWKAGSEGQIIMTDRDDASFYFTYGAAVTEGHYANFKATMNDKATTEHGLIRLKQLLHNWD